MAEKGGPGTAFGGASAAALAPVAAELRGMKAKATSGALRLDSDTAHRLLAELAEAQAKVHRLIADAGGLDTPLRLGDSFVGRVMSERFRDAASSGTSAAIPVLTRFAAALEDLELTVRAAAGLYVAADDGARDELIKAAERVGLEDLVDR